MTKEEILKELASGTRFNEARKIFLNYIDLIAQIYVKDGFKNPFEVRKMEFEAIEKICEIYGIDPRSA